MGKPNNLVVFENKENEGSEHDSRNRLRSD